jgi:hypothetical protein
MSLSIRSLFTLLPLIALSLPDSAAQRAAEPAALRLAPGATRTVPKTTRLGELEVGDGATLLAPVGSSLTLVVNGVQRPLQPGHWRGQVTLAVTADVPLRSASVGPHLLRAAVIVADGHLRTDRSVMAAAQGGTVTDDVARDVRIRSEGEAFNGIVVAGNSRYLIERPRIELTGNGGDDTTGYGAAILATDHADVTVQSPRIRTRGAIRSAIFVSGDATVRVRDADIEVQDGVLPPDYQPNIGDGKVMMEVPWMLGIRGNVRATNVVERGTVEYERSHIRAQAWGALSTDGVERVRMTVRDSLIEAVESGYGAYALGDSVDVFDHCTFDVADYALIIGGGGTGRFTGQSIVRSRRFGVMAHQGNGGSVRIEDGTDFSSAQTLVLAKGSGLSVTIDHAQVHAGNGVLVQTMPNDDPFMKAMAARGALDGGAMPGAGPKRPPKPADVDVRIAHTVLAGDLLHAMSELGSLNVTLGDGTRLSGAISAAEAAPAGGREPTRATYAEIGEVTNVLGPARGPHGVQVRLERGAVWQVTHTSYLENLEMADGAVVVAAPGRRLTLQVNGESVPLRPGQFSGRVALLVMPVGG